MKNQAENYYNIVTTLKYNTKQVNFNYNPDDDGDDKYVDPYTPEQKSKYISIVKKIIEEYKEENKDDYDTSSGFNLSPSEIVSDIFAEYDSKDWSEEEILDKLKLGTKKMLRRFNSKSNAKNHRENDPFGSKINIIAYEDNEDRLDELRNKRIKKLQDTPAYKIPTLNSILVDINKKAKEEHWEASKHLSMATNELNKRFDELEKIEKDKKDK